MIGTEQATVQRRGVIQRTLVITCGKGGAEVGRLLGEMLKEWGSPPVVRVLSLRADEDGQAGALDVEGAEVQSLDAALVGISRLSHRLPLQKLGFRLDRLGELVVWVVASAEAPMARVAQCVAARAEALLATDALVMGIRMHDGGLPDEASIITGARQSEGLVSSRSTGEADRTASSLSPETLTAFSGPCYLVTLLNEAGLALEGPEELHVRVARFLALHTCTGLRDIPVWLAQGQPWAAARACPSFGLVWVAWPGGVAQVRAAQRLKQSVLTYLLNPESGPQAESALESVAAPPGLVVESLTPGDLAAATYRAAKETRPAAPVEILQPSDPQVRHPLLVRWEAEEAACTAAANPPDSTWEARLNAAVADAHAELQLRLGTVLDSQGLPATRSALLGLRRRLEDWAGAVEIRVDEIETGLAELSADADAVWRELEGRLGKMPRRRLRHFLRLLTHPLTFLSIVRQWHKVREGHQRYLHLRAGVLSMQVGRRQMEQARLLYERLDATGCDLLAAVDVLEQSVRQVLAPMPDLPDWPADSLLLPVDADELLDAQMVRLLPAAAAVAEQWLAEMGPLSRWMESGAPGPTEADEDFKAMTASLLCVSLADVLRHRFDDNGLGAWRQELDVQAAPFWRWEPATISEDDRAGLGLIRLSLVAPELATLMPNDIEGGSICGRERVVPLERTECMALVNLRCGVPMQ